jgi:RHS repeat-associated protein
MAGEDCRQYDGMTFTVQIPVDSVTFEGGTYDQGHPFKSEDPTEVIQFGAAALDQLKKKGFELDLGTPEFWKTVKAAYLCQVGEQPDPPPVAHDPGKTPPADPEADGRPRREAESPERLDAPAPQSEALTGSREPADPVGTPAELAHDRQEPLSDGEIADRLADADVPPDEIEERLEQARRGDPQEGQPHPFRSDDAPERGVAVSDPVDLFRGEFTITCTDLELPGCGFDFRLVRRYRSGPPAYGPFGFNWDHSYNVFLRELDDGAVAIWTGELREDVYRPDPAGGFRPPAAARHASLERDSDSLGRTTGYHLVFRGGFQWEFRHPPGWTDGFRYPLVRAADRHGNEHRLAYDTGGRLEAVADTVGRLVRFHYGGCGLLEAVTDPFGRRIKYWHAPDAERLVRVIPPRTGDDLRGDTNFEYGDADHPALRNNITTVWGPGRRLAVENRYEHDPASDAWNRIVEQRMNGHTYQFGYETLRYVDLGPESMNDVASRVEVLEPDRTYRVYSFNVRGLLLDERMRLVADRTYRVWAVSYRYDQNGELSELRRPNGLTTTFRHDSAAADPRARGNLLEVRLVAPPISSLPSRRLWSATYEPRFQELKTVTDEPGGVTRYAYDYEEDPLGAGTGRLVRVEPPDATLPDGSTQTSSDQFIVDDRGRVSRWRTGEGHLFDHSYQVGGPSAEQLRRVVAGAGVEDEALIFGYDQHGYMASITDALGNTWSERRDEIGRLLEQTAPAVDGEAAVTHYRYDRRGDLVEVRRPRGAYVDRILTDGYLHDAIRVDHVRNSETVTTAANAAAPRTDSRWFDHLGRVIRIVDALGRRTSYRYDERGSPLEVSVREPDGTLLRTRYTYDRNGNVRRIRRTGQPDLLCAYDAWDRLVSAATPATSTRLEYEYEVGDRVREVRVVGPRAPGSPPVILSRIEMGYDERGRLVRRTEAGVWQRFWYDRDDRLVRITDQRGRTMAIEPDALGRPRQITDPAGNRVRMVRDTGGNLTDVYEDEVSPTGAVTTYHTVLSYDAAHRLTTVDDGDSHVVTSRYDTRDAMVSVTGPGTEVVELSYDAFGDMSAVRWGPPGSPRTEFVRDAAGRVRGYVDPDGRRTSYEYAADDSWSSIVLPDGRGRTRRYDGFGRVISERGPSGATITTRYGPDGQPYRTSFSPAAGLIGLPDLVLYRDGLARPVHLQQGTEWLTLRWDALGRLDQENSAAGTTGWRHDDASGIADLLYPDGREDRLIFDALDRPARQELLSVGASGLTELAAGDLVAAYSYWGPNRLARRSNGNGTVVDYGYDAARRLAAVSHVDPIGAPLVTVHYVYDDQGRRRVVLNGPSPGINRWYDYDTAGRLRVAVEGFAAPTPPLAATQADQNAYLAALGRPTGAQEQSFGYSDADGRRSIATTTAAGTVTDTYILDPTNRILSLTRSGAGPVAFGYLGDGERSVDDRYRYSYDVLGRLREVRDPAGTSLLRIRHDPAGRVAETAGLGWPARRSVWLGDRVLQQDTGAAAVEQFVTGGRFDETVLASDGADRWAHADARLSLLGTTDSAGAIGERYGYEPFGLASVWAPDGTTPRAASVLGTPPTFGGYRQWLPGLFDGRARAYDAVTGAFLQPDPRGYASGPNPYAFAGQDPIDFVDPTGEIAPIIVAAVIIGALAGTGFSAYDATEHPERYSSGFSWRAMFQTMGGGLVGGLSAVAGIAAGGLTTAAFGGGTAAAGTAAAGSAAGGGLGWFGSFVVSGATGAANMTVARAGFHRMFPEYVDKPTVGSAAGDFAAAGVLKVVAAPVLARFAPGLIRSVSAPIREAAEGIARARQGPWRVFGAQWGLLRGQSTYRWWNLFFDDRTRSTVLSQLRRSPGWERNIGNSMQHLWAMESGSMPQWFRNAGFNLMEVPRGLNSWMTNIPSRNIQLRVAVAGMAAITALTSAELTTRVMGQGEGPWGYLLGGDGTPLFGNVDQPSAQMPPGTPGVTGQSSQGDSGPTGKPSRGA